MVGTMAGITLTTIGVRHTDLIVGIGIGTRAGVGATHIIGVGDIRIITILITTTDLHTTDLHTTTLLTTVE